MKFCPECGSILNKDSKFCGECGFNIRNTSVKIDRQSEINRHIEHYGKKSGGAGKKIALVVVILVILGIGFFLLPRLWIVGAVTGVSGPLMQPPQIDVYDVKLSGIGLTLTLDVYNPNDLPITFDRANFDIYINDAKIGSGSLPNSVSVSGNSHSYPQTSMDISYGGGLAGGWEYLKGALGGATTMKIIGTAYVEVPVLGDIPIPFSYSKNI